MSVMTILLISLPLVFGSSRLLQTKTMQQTKRVRCAIKRCCQYKSESDNSVNCKTLSIDECVSNDNHCVWDCEGPKKGKRKKRKTFVKFDEGLAIPHELDFTAEEFKPEGHKPQTVSDMQEMSAWLTYDKECGDVYKVDIDKSTASDRLVQQETRNQMTVNDFPPDSDKEGNDQDDGTRRRMPILPPDGRVQKLATDFPYTTAVYILYDKSDGRTFSCSGTMISLKTVLTAAHCIYDVDTDQWGSNYRVLVGADDNKDIKKGTWIEWSSATVPLVYTRKPKWSAEYDIGVIRLTEYPGVGYMSFGYNNLLTVPTLLNEFGYPGDKVTGTLWFQSCPYDYKISANKFTSTQCDSAGGQSGSNKYMYWSSTGKRTIFGVHAGGLEGYYTYAARITPAIYGLICDFIEDGGEIFRCS